MDLTAHDAAKTLAMLLSQWASRQANVHKGRYLSFTELERCWSNIVDLADKIPEIM